MSCPVRIILSGVGNRALPKNPDKSNWLGWVELIARSQDFQLVAAHDVSEDALQRLTSRGYLAPRQTYRDLKEMLQNVECDAMLISNPAEHHTFTVKAALDYNLHLFIEKPLSNSLGEARELVDLIEDKGVVASIVQNWRCKDVGLKLREVIKSGLLGRIGHIFFRYLRDRENPNYPAYIFKEEYPLLFAMGSHHLDLFRFILKEEYASVSGQSFKPPWSLYQSTTGLNLFLKTNNDTSVLYSGTISSPNSIITQESLVIEGEKGTLLNESQWLEPPLWFFPKGKKEQIDLTQEIEDATIAGQYNKGDEYLLLNFSKAIAGQEKPICTARDALQSITALEACRLACDTGRTINLEEEFPHQARVN